MTTPRPVDPLLVAFGFARARGRQQGLRPGGGGLVDPPVRRVEIGQPRDRQAGGHAVRNGSSPERHCRRRRGKAQEPHAVKSTLLHERRDMPGKPRHESCAQQEGSSPLRAGRAKHATQPWAMAGGFGGLTHGRTPEYKGGKLGFFTTRPHDNLPGGRFEVFSRRHDWEISSRSGVRRLLRGG